MEVKDEGKSNQSAFQVYSIDLNGKPTQSSILGNITSFFSQLFGQQTSNNENYPFSTSSIQFVNLSKPAEEEDEDVIEGAAMIINPPPKNVRDLQNRNDEIKAYLQATYPDRFEDNATSWKCSSCGIGAAINRPHYVCDECDNFVLCDDCYQFEEVIEQHQIQSNEIQNKKRENHLCFFSEDQLNGKKELKHFGRFFYREQQSRWSSKGYLIQQVYNTSDFIFAAFTKLYKDRFIIGELNDRSNLSSFKVNYGKVIDEDYKWYTTNEVWSFIIQLAKAFQSLEIACGDYVAISAENRLEWAIVDFCCNYLGVVSVAVPSIISKENAESVLSSVPIKAIFVSNQSVYSIISSLHSTNIQYVISFDDISEVSKAFSEMRKPNGCQLLSFTNLIEISSTMIEDTPKGVRLKEDEIITVMFTSGSTGVPKGVQFRERKWLSQITLPMTFKNVVLYGYLPLDHIAGRTDLYTALFNGGRIFFNQSLSYLVGASKIARYIEDLQTIRPTAFGPIPIICNAAYHKYQLVKFQQFNLVGEEIDDQLKKELKVNIKEGFRYIFGDRISSLKVTSAPITPKVVKFLRETLLVMVHEGYGSTEVGSISNDQFVTQKVKLLSVPELKYFIHNDPPQGEILVKGLRTSYVNPLDMQSKMSKGGWFHTGDIGELTGPHSIKVIDRKSNVIKLVNGEFVALENLELLYLKSPFIHQIFLYADSHKSNIVAIILPFCFNNNNTIKDDPQLVDKISFEQSLRDSLHALAIRHHLRSFEIPIDIHIDWETIEWTSNNGLLTTSNKPCRRNLRTKYQQQINSIYLKQSILSTLNDHSNLKIDISNSNKSFIELGGDSLSAIQVLNQLKNQSITGISFEQLMSDQSISQLVIDDQIIIKEEKEDDCVDIEEEKQFLDYLLTKNFSLSEQLAKFTPQSSADLKNIFITGGTGFLGKEIVKELIKQYPSLTLYCLVRKKGALSSLSNQIIEIEGDISKDRFGLTNERFEELSNIIDIIIHGAAIVNHLVTYNDLYKTNVESIFNIIQFATSSKIKIIHYISSVSALRSFQSRQNGYGGTKWATDRILQYCSRKYQLPVYIYRPSLIIGHSENGEVNRKDWFHRFLKALVDFQILPNFEEISSGCYEDSLNMISLDFCAKSIVALINYPYIIHSNAPSSLPYDYFIFNIGYQNIGFLKIIEMMIHLDDSSFQFQQLSYKDWFSQISSKVKENRHVALPFISNFESGITSSSPRYDTHSFEFALNACGCSLSFSPLSTSELHKTLLSLRN